MSNRTRTILLFSILACGLTVALVAFSMHEISRRGQSLSEHVKILAEHAAKEQMRAQLSRQAEETAAERADLSAFFLENADDSIDVLNQIEELADAFGLEGETVGLASGGEEPDTYINIQFRFAGEQSAVERFAKTLEVVPYHAEVRSLTLSQIGGSAGWEGAVQLRVSTLAP